MIQQLALVACQLPEKKGNAKDHYITRIKRNRAKYLLTKSFDLYKGNTELDNFRMDQACKVGRKNEGFLLFHSTDRATCLSNS